MKNNLKEGEGVKALSAEEVLHKHLQNDLSYRVSEAQGNIIAAMEEYALQPERVEVNAIHCTCPNCGKDYDIEPVKGTTIPLQSTPKLSDQQYMGNTFSEKEVRKLLLECLHRFSDMGYEYTHRYADDAIKRAMPNIEPNVKESDARNDDSSTTADPKK